VRVEVEPLQGGDLEEAAGRIVVRSAAVAHSCVPSDAAGGGPGGGRFATGDLGCLDADGRLRLVGRLGLLVNVGGHKVNPAEVERALRALPPVREAVVLAVADRRRGQALAACVESEPGVSRESILESLAGLLPRYKLPRRLLLVRDLPRTERGKPDRARIQDLLGISNPPG
jgi:acyl-CoA synthetase (AMP-forming)/AMP-acid ligase II